VANHKSKDSLRREAYLLKQLQTICDDEKVTWEGPADRWDLCIPRIEFARNVILAEPHYQKAKKTFIKILLLLLVIVNFLSIINVTAVVMRGEIKNVLISFR
jgi:hypothetical protein